MCDYSLHGVRNRLAEEGEQLFINKFHTGSKGLAAVKDFEEVRLNWFGRLVNHFWSGTIENPAHNLTAVCVPPGAKLMLSGIGLGTRQELDVDEVEEVTFVQLTAEPFRYRDAFRLDHRILLPCNPYRGHDTLSLQNLPEGVCVEVLQLELEEETAITDERRMAAHG